ncbi:sensor histidine kinase [Nocardioides sambongensis]|uniref:sensor histidine kinase n=1 Tax=Nocardioides sambongensis TaxID=2589074 RepID=UPI0018C88CF1|nr:sensor histidine kinase [Nocardioides sambongensis]
MTSATTALIRSETRLFLREPISVFWVTAFPPLLLLGLGLVPSFREPSDDLGGQSVLQLYVPTMVLFSMIVVGAQAMPEVMVGYRQRRILRRLQTTPVGPARLLLAHVVAHAAAVVVATVLCLLIGRIAYDAPLPRDLVGYLVAYLLALAAMMATGAAITALSPTTSVANVLGMVVMFTSMFTAGVWIAVQAMPETLREIVIRTPMGRPPRHSTGPPSASSPRWTTWPRCWPGRSCSGSSRCAGSAGSERLQPMSPAANPAPSPVTGPVESFEERWGQMFARIPYVVLAVAAVVALLTGPHTGATSPGWRLTAQLVVLVATLACLAWGTWLGRRDASRREGIAFYVVRTALALLLTLLNPLFCLFGWIGFLDADEHFRGRAVWGALGACSVILALGQSGGLPFDSFGHTALFVILVGVNFGLSASMSRWATWMTATSDQRAEMITELERLNAELEQTAAENVALHATVVEQARAAGMQEERQRLAREIHDGIAQSLAAVLSQLQAAQDDADPRGRISRATELAREALTEARRSMLDLSPAPLTDHDLADAMTGLVDSWAADQAARADVVITGEVRPLHPEVEATVLRITQEALSNVAKHAGAGRVGVTLTYDDTEVILDVRDDGVGFDPVAAAPPTSFGLRGMRQRTERLAGALELETRPGGGTAVSARLPALGAGAA